MIVALAIAWAAVAAGAESAAPPQDFDAAARDLWTRGSQRFQRQWLVASPGAPDVAAISAAQAVPRIGEPVASDPNVRWLPLTAWSDIVDVGAAIDDLSAARKPTMAYASISRKTAGDAELSFGADGLYEIWLNGERVFSHQGPPSGFTPATTVRDAFVHEAASSYSGIEGLLNVPVLVTHGDVDRAVNVEGSRHATRMLQRWNYDVRYHEMPGYGHEDLGERESIVDWLLEHRRNAAPKHVRIRSTDLRGAQAPTRTRSCSRTARSTRASCESVPDWRVR